MPWQPFSDMWEAQRCVRDPHERDGTWLGRSVHRSPLAFGVLLAHLRGLGASATVTPAEGLLERYRIYLVEERGLAATSIRNYAKFAEALVAEGSPGPIGVEGLSAGRVRGFVALAWKGRRAGSVKKTRTGDV